MAGPGASGKIFADAQKLHQKGELLAALRLYDSILASGPTPGARVYRALCLVQLGRKVEAGNEATRAYESLSNPSLMLSTTLGTVFRHLGQLKDAELLFREALSIAPESGAVRSNLGLTLMQRMKLKEAAEEFEAATSLLPEDAAPPLNRGRIAIREQDFGKAELMLEEAKRRDPGHPDVGILEHDVALSSGKHDVAFAAIVRTLGRKPTLFEAWRRVGRIDPNAVENAPLEKAASELVRAKSTSAALIAAAIGILRKFLAWNSLYELERQLSEILEQGKDAAIDTSGVFLLLSCTVSQKAHRAAAHSSWRALANPNAVESRPSIHPIENRKLRIGYLSSDLRGHAVGYLVAGVMEAHEDEGFEWLAYSNHVDDGSEIRARMRGAFDRFVNITNLTDSELAEHIREDQIDVLVDLNGMTAETRATVFAYNPSPITVTWLGMPGTLGAGDKVDYVLLDQWVAHPDNLDGFDESPVILPGSYQPNDGNRPELELAGSRTEHGLPEGAIVFASFNQTQKFSPDTVAVWEEILLQVPDGVLWVLAPEPAIEERFTKIFENAGIDRERIIFAPRMGHQHHLARISHADLMLDNWPYNAHTTCADALRAGTPVLTLPGRTFASRVAASILATAGLADWIASDKADYAEKAVSFARAGRSAIDQEKARVTESYHHSAMPDCKSFARKLEAFYRAAAERVAAGLEPTALHVRPDGDVSEGLPADTNWQMVSASTADVHKTLSSSETDRRREASAKGDLKSNAHTDDPPSIQRGSPAARLHNLEILRDRVINIGRLPLLVDVGAASMPGSPVLFDTLSSHGIVDLIGFEPDETAFEALVASAKGNQKYKKIALGDGNKHHLRICKARGMNSLLEPDVSWLNHFPKFGEWAEVQTQEDLETIRLDEVSDLKDVDLIKLDIQGMESAVLIHGTRSLNSAVMVQLEMSPIPLYKDEPSFWRLGAMLEDLGFVLHTFPDINRRAFKPYGHDDEPFNAVNHIFQLDAVFIKDPRRFDFLSSEKLRALAFLSHSIYKSYDLAMLALSHVDKREGTRRVADYEAYLRKGGEDA